MEDDAFTSYFIFEILIEMLIEILNEENVKLFWRIEIHFFKSFKNKNAKLTFNMPP